MGDQQRWFKLWCSAPSDDGIQSMPPADRWAWVAFGAYTKLHGTQGTVTVSPSNAALAAEMGVTVDDLISVLQRLPHMRISEPESVNGKVTVTWKNWIRYQEDSTVNERQKTLRAKKRREEIRRELPPKPPGPMSLSRVETAERSEPSEPSKGDYTAIVERLGEKLKGSQ